MTTFFAIIICPVFSRDVHLNFFVASLPCWRMKWIEIAIRVQVQETWGPKYLLLNLKTIVCVVLHS